MNERIKELAKQAGLRVEMWMTNPPKPFQILGSTEQFEKFSELLIQDAVNVCLAERDPQNLNYKPSVKFAEAIKRHFGAK